MMPRLFWKIFLALWLSIMAFSAVMAWVNASLVMHQPQDVREEVLLRVVAEAGKKLVKALEQDDLEMATGMLKRLPRQERNHLYVMQRGERELLGRDRALEHLKKRRVPFERTIVTSASGARYHLVVLERLPPVALLEPGLRGILHRLLIAGFVSALLSAWLARYLSRPLTHLGRASRRLAAGDLAARVGRPLDHRGDEFGQLARDLDDMAARLQELQAANRRLLRDVSHELRSPLARMRVALELARGRKDGQVSSELDRIELESERLERLIDEVLGLLRESSESAPLQAEAFDLSELLSDLCDVVNYEAPESGPGIMQSVSSPLPVVADRELIWRAVENLLRNALRHTDVTQGVTLSARPVGEERVEIRVADRGPGIPAPQLHRIFEPFYRVQEARDRDSGGHGLGLAIAAAAVRRHRGRIQAENRSGGGLEFRIELPLDAATGASSGAVGAEGHDLGE